MYVLGGKDWKTRDKYPSQKVREKASKLNSKLILVLKGHNVITDTFYSQWLETILLFLLSFIRF